MIKFSIIILKDFSIEKRELDLDIANKKEKVFNNTIKFNKIIRGIK